MSIGLTKIVIFEKAEGQIFINPPVSGVSRGVYWNQAQKIFTHQYTEYPWVFVTLSLCGQ